MKIDTRQIPDEGLTLAEEFSSAELDLETEIIKFSGPIKAKADILKSYDAIKVELSLDAPMLINCSRCLEERTASFNKKIALHYAVDKLQPVIDTSTSLSINGERSRTIDLNPDIREEIILSYPMNPLCRKDCKGLCPKCGKNLNIEQCNC